MPFDAFPQALSLLGNSLQLLNVVVGTLIGVLIAAGTQLRAIHVVALFLPLTYTLNLPVESTLILLLAIYYAASFGRQNGADQKNELPAARWIRVTSEEFFFDIGSFFGGLCAMCGLLLLVSVMEKVALRFGPEEYFTLVIFALASLSLRVGQYPLRTLVSGVLGLMLATIGIDPTTGVLRFTFNEPQLFDGIEFSTVVVGLFVISQLPALLLAPAEPPRTVPAEHPAKERKPPLMNYKWTLVRSAVSGFLIGLLPGAGASIASASSAQLESRFFSSHHGPRHRRRQETLAAETANTAAVGGAMAPLLALGIPGSGTAAIMLGALLLHNITPGPGLFTQHTDLVWSLAAAMGLANFLLLLGRSQLVRRIQALGQVPAWVLAPTMTVLAFVGVFSVNKSSLSLLIMLIIGMLGYCLERWRYPLVPLLLGFVLGDLMENNLRRALAVSGGDLQILIDSPVSKLFCILSVLVVVLALFLGRLHNRNSTSTAPPEAER